MAQQQSQIPAQTPTQTPTPAQTIIPSKQQLDCIYNLFIDGSPIILATIFTSLSFIFQNATGVIYLAFLFFLSLR